jgi:predicted ATP-binding protein involved in virulence
MTSAVDRLVALAGLSYVGLDAASFEPTFMTADGRSLSFDALPTRARHLVAFAALSVRVLWSAYPGRDPRASEGVVAIDEVDAHQDPAIQAALVSALSEALPGVQWILTTTSPVVAGSCDTRDVLALRRLPRTTRVELYVGSEARTH